jgi:hypothetical protein
MDAVAAVDEQDWRRRLVEQRQLGEPRDVVLERGAAEQPRWRSRADLSSKIG